MRAVNLLPERDRPRGPTGSRRGSSYVLLGLLGALLIAVLLYVLTLNSINDSKGKIAAANAEAARDNAAAGSLGAYGDFDKIKTERLSAVKQLAQGRIDWERLMRELSLVLPNNVWLTNASAADSPQDAQGGSGSSSSPSTGTKPQGSNGPTLTLDGCATSQSDVAVTLVRLHELEGASDVHLEHSAKPSKSGSSPSTSTGGAGCGLTHGRPNYEFLVDVSFAPQSSAPATAAGSLGGGS